MTGRVLCVDYGTARIGLAVSDPGGTMALPLEVVPVDGAVELVAERARELDVREIVVGLPLRTTGEAGPEAEAARGLAKRLQDATGVTVRLWDERFSSAEAERVMRAQGADARRRRGNVDKVAAAIVLQSYLDAHANQ
jgi:putative Holliday junction resolvase